MGGGIWSQKTCWSLRHSPRRKPRAPAHLGVRRGTSDGFGRFGESETRMRRGQTAAEKEKDERRGKEEPGREEEPGKREEKGEK